MTDVAAAAAAKSFQSCPTLCDPIDGSPPGSPVPGILQAGTLEWVAISFSNAWKWKVKSEIEVAQSSPTLSDPMDRSLPGSPVHGILQARVLERVAITRIRQLKRSGRSHRIFIISGRSFLPLRLRTSQLRNLKLQGWEHKFCKWVIGNDGKKD